MGQCDEIVELKQKLLTLILQDGIAKKKTHRLLNVEKIDVSKLNKKKSYFFEKCSDRSREEFLTGRLINRPTDGHKGSNKTLVFVFR